MIPHHFDNNFDKDMMLSSTFTAAATNIYIYIAAAAAAVGVKVTDNII